MTIDNLLFWVFIFLAVPTILYLLWLIIPIFSGLPWIPTRPGRIRRALELAQINRDEIFYDLGSGDGRALILAASEFGAHAIGVEISPIHCIFARVNALLHGISNRVEIRWGSFYKADFSNADVIFIYMTSREASRLKPHLENSLHPGARVISISCEVDGWQPVEFDRDELIYIYKIGTF